MVVTRKGSSVTPAPAVSRTNSSTSTPKRKQKALPGSATPPPDAFPPAPAVATITPWREPIGPEFADPPKVVGSSPLRQSSKVSNSPIKTMSGTPRNRRIVSGRLNTTVPKAPSSTHPVKKTLLSIVAFAFVAHIIAICPHDHKLESGVCGSLHTLQGSFKKNILEPYVQPQVDKVLAHPSVARVYNPVAGQLSSAIDSLGPHARVLGLKFNQAYLHYWDEGERKFYEHYNPNVSPYVEKYINTPYKVYILPLEPRLHQLEATADRLLEPLVRQLSTQLERALRVGEGYAVVAWEHAREVPALIFQRGWEPLMDARRTYVDPPISKIMEAVEDVGTEVKSTAAKLETSLGANAAETPASPAEQDVIFDNEELVDEEFTDDTVASEAFVSTEAEHATVSEPDSIVTPEPDVILEAPAPEAEEEDVDLDAFLRELEDVADETAPEPEVTPAKPTETPPTLEEVQARRKARAPENAKKRAEIEERHTKWEEQIRTAFESATSSFPATLEQLRQQAIDELAVAEYAANLKQDAARALKNMEALIKKLANEAGTPEERQALLNTMVGKVKRRFEDGSRIISESVVTWGQKAQQAEDTEIARLVKSVHVIGERAQANLGLDYAWLDDVAVKDWQRYHGLADYSKRLEQQLRKFLSGDAPDSSSNVLSAAMRDLQIELEQVVDHFQTRLSDAHKKGLQAIWPRKDDTAQQASTGSLSASATEPTFSILPIGDTGENVQADDSVEYIFLKKGKEQVEDALSMAEAALKGETSSTTTSPSSTPYTQEHVEL